MSEFCTYVTLESLLTHNTKEIIKRYSNFETILTREYMYKTQTQKEQIKKEIWNYIKKLTPKQLLFDVLNLKYIGKNNNMFNSFVDDNEKAIFTILQHLSSELRHAKKCEPKENYILILRFKEDENGYYLKKINVKDFTNEEPFVIKELESPFDSERIFQFTIEPSLIKGNSSFIDNSKLKIKNLEPKIKKYFNFLEKEV